MEITNYTNLNRLDPVSEFIKNSIKERMFLQLERKDNSTATVNIIGDYVHIIFDKKIHKTNIIYNKKGEIEYLC